MTSKRQLAAIMFTDISGFSAMMQKDEAYAKEILQRHRSVLSKSHGEFGGNILQYIGDGTLSIFSSAVDAVECAVAMQIALRQDPHVPLRIGIHTGDITYDDNGAFGDGVNITARVEGLCVPGAVYLTGKVYDDIKNHSWLRAIRLGDFELHNISSSIDLYAVSNRDLALPSDAELITKSDHGAMQGHVAQTGYKSKTVAWLLALFLGVFGVHRLYLGQKFIGILYLLAFMATMAIVVSGGPPFIVVLGIIAFIDAVLLLAMPRVDFDRKYNEKSAKVKRSRFSRKQSEPRKARRRPRKKSSVPQTLLQKGARSLAEGRYREAIKWLDEALDQDEHNKEAHYHLASCFSMLKDEENAYYHLASAVENGYRDYEKIKKDIHLYHLRSLPSFASFEKAGYKIIKPLPEPKPDLLQSERFDPSILEKIEVLGDLLENGELTQQEFQMQKEQILRGD